MVLLHPPHLSRALASSGVRFPPRSLQTLSRARRRARRVPRPPCRSVMAKAKPWAWGVGAPDRSGTRGPPGSAHLRRNASSGPPPSANSGTARSPCGRGTDPDVVGARELRLRFCRGRPHPGPLRPSPRSPRSFAQLLMPPEAPSAHRVRTAPKFGRQEVGRERGARRRN